MLDTCGDTTMETELENMGRCRATEGDSEMEIRVICLHIKAFHIWDGLRMYLVFNKLRTMTSVEARATLFGVCRSCICPDLQSV